MVGPKDGDHYAFLNHLASVKVAGSERSMSVVQFTGPQGFGPPLHRHTDEDELFIIVDGELRFFLGDEATVHGPGGCAYLPRQIPHTFQVMSTTARFVTVTAGHEAGQQFDSFVAALGTPIEHPAMPEPGYVDPTEVAEVARRFGIEIVGPPPAPLASN